jgi:NitT/TauT family transport system permease protein/taurine transport system permease protein
MNKLLRAKADIQAKRIDVGPGTRWMTPIWRRFESVGGFVVVIAVWQLAQQASGLPSTLFPSSLDALHALVDLYQIGILYEYTLLSLSHYLLGLGLGAGIGLALGLLISSNRRVSDILMPLVNFTYAIVEVAWIPLLILWWGYSPATIVVAVAYVVASPLVHNIVTGVRSIPPVYIRAVRALGGDRRVVLTEVILPAIVPSLFNGLRVGAGFGFRALIFSEMISQSEGIGYLIFTSAASQQTARTVAGMIVMGALWLFLDRMYLRPLERMSTYRWGLSSEAEK